MGKQISFFVGVIVGIAIMFAVFSYFYSIPNISPHSHVYPFDHLAEPRTGRGGVYDRN